MTSSPSISPIPFFTDLAMSVTGIPNARPVAIEMIRKARKGLNFAQVINNTSSSMARIMITIVISLVLALRLSAEYR
jgi:hypothetical protein